MRYIFELNRSWSTYVNYLILTGIPLALALPTSARVEVLIEPRLHLASIFMIIAPVLLAVYSFNFGLAYARLDIAHRDICVSLGAHVLFLMVLSLPYWTVWVGIMGHGVDRLVGALGYLGLYGAWWALLGVPVGRRWPSEIAQFHIKYALLIVSVGATFFVLRPLNPLLMLSLWFGEGALREHVGFVITGYLGLLAGVLAVAWWGIRGVNYVLTQDHTR